MDVCHIPGTKDFFATTDGRILDKHHQERNQYINGDGYRTASVLLTNGKWQTFGVHRLVALAFIPCHGDINELTVNHRDFNIHNNSMSNLEWVTVNDNNIHASLMNGSKERPSIIAVRPTGEIEFVSNIHKVAKMMLCDETLVWDAIRERSSINGWKFSFYGSHSSMPKELRKKNYSGIGKNKLISRKAIKLLNLKDQSIKEYRSYLDVGKDHGVSASHVFQCVSRNGKVKLFKRQFIIVEADDEFPIFTQEMYETLLQPTGKSVLAYNVELKKLVLYESASQFIKENGLSKKAVTVDLKKNRLRLVNGWWFTYATSSNVNRLKALVTCPA